MRVLTFGELLLRLSAPGYNKLFQKDSFDVTFCGGEANVAVSLANLGVASGFVTKLPNNEIGYSAERELHYFGVDTTKVSYGDGRMGLYYLERGASQRPSKIIYDRKYSSLALAREEEFDWDALFEGVEWFHFTGITPALSDNLKKICLAACKIAKNRNIVVSCDLNYRSNLWDADEAKITMDRLMHYVDVCIGNEEDADKALGIKAENTSVELGNIDKKAYSEVATKICSKYGCRKVAFTLRESVSASRNGWSAILYDKEKNESFFSKYYDIQIVDRVGGGDSFSAGLIYALLMEMSEQKSIDFATAASCLKQTMEGDFNRSSYDDICKLMCDGGNGRVQR